MFMNIVIFMGYGKILLNNIIKGTNSVPEDIKEELKKSLHDRYVLRDKLNNVYDKYIKKDINKIVLATSIKVACSTGMSKNNTFDAFTTIISNIRYSEIITSTITIRNLY